MTAEIVTVDLAPFHRHRQHITPRRGKQIANQPCQTRSPRGRAGPFMTLRAAGHKFGFYLLLLSLFVKLLETFFCVRFRRFFRQVAPPSITKFVLL